MTRIPLAVAGAPAIGHVDENGYVWLSDGSRIEWWVLGDDHWHAPSASPTLRQRTVDNSPVVETSIRVPGGDVAWRVGAASTGDGAVIVSECENRASIPIAVGVARVVDGDVVSLDVHPVTHTSTWRGTVGAAAVGSLPDLETVGRGWLALARQGAHITTNDPVVDDALTAARASLLVHHGELMAQGKRVNKAVAAAVASALTMLDYEDEAGELRRAARLKPVRKGLPIVEIVANPTITTDPIVLLANPQVAAETVMAIRGLVVDDRERSLDCLPGFDDAWRGRSVDVSDLPTNQGTLAYAVRWHGDRPALLWEMSPTAARLSARAVDSSWSTDEATGEALLATPRA